MYYAEEIIDGVLHCKHTPEGEWIPLSAQALTTKIVKLRAERDDLGNELQQIKRWE